MQIKDAVAACFRRICYERNISFNDLAVRSGVTPSTVYSLMDSRRRSVSVSTIKKLCDGLEISVRDFFSATEFDRLEQEIQ
ncbi:MAG: helix-turn-helix transcriptional regulator [Lachnospiraceae bacterium]|nr:helix-turn-helix transcriptional regulator [Lachnospiraceae bacterium]